MVLLNKIDLINPEDLPELEFKLRNLNGAARICQTRNSDVDIATVLDLRSLDVEVRAEKHDHDHRHTEDIETVAVTTPGDLDGLKLSHWFRELLAEFGERIMRMKGILNLRKDPDQFVFQGVGVTGGEQGGGTQSGHATTFAAALDELAKYPGGQRDENQKRDHPPDAVPIVNGEDAAQPDASRGHRETHGHFEPLHPRAWFGEDFQPGGLPTQRQVRRGDTGRLDVRGNTCD